MGMLQFRPISINDKLLFDNALNNNEIASCDYSFATIFCWQDHFKTEITEAFDCILLRYIDFDGNISYAPPLGHGDVKKSIDAMILDASERKQTFRLGAVTRSFYFQLIRFFGDRLHVDFQRSQAEYIYLRDDLASLKGSSLKAKRNHVNKFHNCFPNFRVEQMNNDNAPRALSLYDEWRQQISGRDDDENELNDERKSVVRALENFDTLNLRGLSLWVDEKMIAFSYGEMITSDTFLTHVEKALTLYDGAYAMINKLMAENIDSSATYINREEDMGLEYIRKAKMSYCPTLLLEKGFAYIL